MRFSGVLVNKITIGPRCVFKRFNSHQSNIARLCNLAKGRGLYCERFEKNLQTMDPKRFQQLMEETEEHNNNTLLDQLIMDQIINKVIKNQYISRQELEQRQLLLEAIPKQTAPISKQIPQAMPEQASQPTTALEPLFNFVIVPFKPKDPQQAMMHVCIAYYKSLGMTNLDPYDHPFIFKDIALKLNVLKQTLSNNHLGDPCSRFDYEYGYEDRKEMIENFENKLLEIDQMSGKLRYIHLNELIKETLTTAKELFENGSLMVLFSPQEFAFINRQICRGSQSNTIQFRLALEAVVKKRELDKIKEFIHK